MNKLSKKLLWFLIPAGLLIGGVAVAVNITVPQATAPGQVLVGNANGTYSPVATSTLGIVSTSTSSVQSILLPLITNGTVAGVNATNSTTTLLVQGTGTLNPFAVASSSGANYLTVTSAGNVGVGTTTPQALLSLPLGTTAANGINFGDATANLYRDTAGRIKVDGTFNIGTSLIVGTTMSAGSSFGINGRSVFTSAANNNMRVSNSGGTDFNLFQFGGTTSGFAAIQSSSSTNAQGVAVKVIAADGSSSANLLVTGNVGIGTTTPVAKLDVYGTSGSTANLLNLASSSNVSVFSVSNAGAVSGASGTFTGALQSASWTDTINTISTFASRTTFRKSSAGVTEFGVSSNGTQTSDAAVLKVYGSDYGASSNSWEMLFDTCGSSGCTGFTGLQNTANAGLIGMTNDGGTPPTGFHDLVVMTQATSTGGVTVLREALRVKAGTTPNVNFFSGLQAGRVGIGSSSPTALLTVNGTSSSPSEVLLNVASSSYASLFNVQSSGNVGVGTTTPQMKLAVSGVYGSTEPATTTISSASYTMDLSAGNFLPFSVATSTTITFSNAQPGPAYYLEMRQDSTGSRTMTFSNCSWSGASAPTFTTTANAVDLVVVRYSASFNKYYCQSSLNY